MKQWVWYLGLATAVLSLGGLAACSEPGGESNQLGGSSFETENSVAVLVQFADGTPAARASLLVRPEGFLAGASSSHAMDKDSVTLADSTSGIFNLTADEQGQLDLKKIKSGRYVIEARGENQKAFAHITVRDSVSDSLSMSLSETGSLKGQVLLPSGAKSATVGVRGLDYVVRTDSLGNFEFPSLPEGSVDAVGFVLTTYVVVNEDGKLSAFDSFQALGSAEVEVESADATTDVTIGTRPVERDPVPEDTVETYPYVLLDDFETNTYAWYTSVSRYASVKLTTDDAGAGREGSAAHMECARDSAYNVWTMMGRGFIDFKDFSAMDSVVLWARGGSKSGDSVWISVSFDVLVDSTSEYESGKSWTHVGISEDWSRIVITPDMLVPVDSNNTGGNIGWDAVKDHVNSFGIFGGRKGAGEFEIWIDDVEIFGVKDLF